MHRSQAIPLLGYQDGRSRYKAACSYFPAAKTTKQSHKITKRRTTSRRPHTVYSSVLSFLLYFHFLELIVQVDHFVFFRRPSILLVVFAPTVMRSPLAVLVLLSWLLLSSETTTRQRPNNCCCWTIKSNHESRIASHKSTIALLPPLDDQQTKKSRSTSP